MVFCRYDNLSYLCNFIDTLDLDNTSFFILLLVIKNTYLYFAKRVIFQYFKGNQSFVDKCGRKIRVR